MRYDYIIVGQGLAGTFLSYELQKKGKKILVIDDNAPDSSSRIAAGIFNPVTGRRFVKTWMAETLIPFSEIFYTEMELMLKEDFYYRKKIFKPFSSIKERNDFQARDDESIQHFISEAPVNLHKGMESIFGGVFLYPAGFVNVKKLLESYRNYLIQNDVLLNESFDFTSLIIQEERVFYKDISCEKIIFCEGYKGAGNPYFSWLPFNPAKGEIITVKIENFTTENIISKGIFILPTGDSLYKVGATYTWTELNETPTESAKEDLIDKLKALIDLPFEVIGHQAAVRPTTRDRRPFLGMHPEYKNIGIFNGLGTKGVLLGPYLAREFAEHLENAGALNHEADIARFNV